LTCCPNLSPTKIDFVKMIQPSRNIKVGLKGKEGQVKGKPETPESVSEKASALPSQKKHFKKKSQSQNAQKLE